MLQIPLDQFEQYIDETILKRGLSYFEHGQVQDAEEITPGSYEFLVQGTENYTVRLNLDKGIVTEFTCDCPYDFGPVCKHVAAAIFHLQEEELDLTRKSRPRKKKSKKPKRKTVARQVEDVLSNLSQDELKQFVHEQALNDKTFRNLLLSTFAHQNDSESKAFYAQQVRSILKGAAGRHGFIDWSAGRHVGMAVHQLMGTAQEHADQGNYLSAILIASAVMEEMTKTLNYADDSNGDISGSINDAYHMLYDMASAGLPEEMRKQLFDYSLKAYEQNLFKGWDWHIGVLELAALLFRNEKEATKIIALLDRVEQTEFDYEYRQAQTIKLDILKKTKGKKAAEKFIEQNLANPSLRAEAIQNAISKKDYKKAISIAQDGIRDDAKDKPGLVMDWYEWLLKIALEQQDTNKIIEYARLLFVDSIKERKPFYAVLKTHVPRDQWSQFVEGLIRDLSGKNRWFNFDLIAQIYINEESWEQLYRLLEQTLLNGSTGLERIKHYEKYLARDYAEGLSEFYEIGVLRLFDNHTGRKHYKKACRYIRRMIKLGQHKKAQRLVEKLRATYPKRSALMEELDSI